MTAFTILLEKQMLGAQVAAGAIATVRMVSSGVDSTTRWRKQVPVEAGFGAGTMVDVPVAGVYDIELVTPSGEVLSDQQNVADGEIKRVAFTVGESPHEWLSWQRLSGYVPKKSAYYDQRLWRAPTAVNESLAAHPEIREAVIERNRTMWSKVIASSGHRSSTTNSAFVRMREETRTRYGELKIVPHPLRSKILTTEADARILQWLIEPEVPWTHPDTWPRWGFVTVDQACELATLPMPWTPDGRIEVSFDRGRPDAMAHSTVIVRDPQFAGVLGYLGSGRMDYANLIIQADDYGIIQSLIHDKMMNPLAAAGAAVIAVLATKETVLQRWDPWLDNLTNFFSWMPDGAVVLAHRRLQQAQAEHEFDFARDKFVQAFDRGIPYYVAALSMLSGGLGQFATESKEIEARYQETVALLSMVDPNQPFTVIRLAGKVGHATNG